LQVLSLRAEKEVNLVLIEVGRGLHLGDIVDKVERLRQGLLRRLLLGRRGHACAGGVQRGSRRRKQQQQAQVEQPARPPGGTWGTQPTEQDQFSSVTGFAQL